MVEAGYQRDIGCHRGRSFCHLDVEDVAFVIRNCKNPSLLSSKGDFFKPKEKLLQCIGEGQYPL